MGIEPTWLAWKARALPLSYTRPFFTSYEMVGATGFEPAAPWSQTKCATKLRYAPNFLTAKLSIPNKGMACQRKCDANFSALLVWAWAGLTHREHLPPPKDRCENGLADRRKSVLPKALS